MKSAEVILYPKYVRPLNLENRDALMSQLQQALQDRVTEAYLFGSFATGRVQADSDIDLILVTETKLPWPERHKEFADLFKIYPEIDLLIYTPAEWQQKQLRMQEPGFWQSVRDSLLRLYPPPG